MIRLILYILGSLIIAAIATWIFALPGSVTIEAAGYRMQPGLGAAVAIFIVILLVAILAWAIIRRVLGMPSFFTRRAEAKRHNEGVDALSNGYIALEAGDAAKARQLARTAQNRLPGNAAAQLLEARADLAAGNYKLAREHYKALISNEKTALAALSGLYEQARLQGRDQAALTFARKAAALEPALKWAGTAVFEDMIRRRAWDEAIKSVSTEMPSGRTDRGDKKRRLCVLHTAEAQECEANTPAKALEHALAALKLAPDFTPAALIAARIHINNGDTRKANTLLRRVWRANHHPDIATLFAHAQPGASAVQRLKHLRELVPTPPEDLSSAIVLARAAIDAYEWVAARNALAAYAGDNPSQAVCLLMAEIEEGQNGDQGKAREWLARAVRAPKDPQWVADGVVADEWEPVSPVTGKLDAFEWKIPVSAMATRSGATSSSEGTSEAPDQSQNPPAREALPASGA